MLTMTCAASIPLPGGRFGRCPEVALRPFRSNMFCEKHIEMAEKVASRHHPAYDIFQSIMEQPDLAGRCPSCLGTEAVCRCGALPDRLA